MAEANKKENVFARIGRWFREMRSELKKVTWPTFRQVVNNTAVVLAVVVGSGVFIGLVDILFKYLMGLLVGAN